MPWRTGAGVYGAQSARNYVRCLNVMIGLGRVYHPHLPDREAENRDVVGQGRPGNCSSGGLELTAAWLQHPWLLLHSSAWCLNPMKRNALFLGGDRSLETLSASPRVVSHGPENTSLQPGREMGESLFALSWSGITNGSSSLGESRLSAKQLKWGLPWSPEPPCSVASISSP